MIGRSFTAVLVAAFSTIALAGPTGLSNIPTADILRHREMLLAYGSSGTERHIDKSVGHYIGLQLGLFDRLEFGLDNDFLGSSVTNAKLLLWESPDEGRSALSIGIRNWATDNTAEYYIVGRYDMPGHRLHLGAMRTDRWLIIAGVDFPVNDQWSASLDFTSGPSSSTWLGLDYAIPSISGLNITFMAGVPAVKSEGLQWAIQASYGLRF
ncbi:hypothetical protein QPK87_07270 [Kamptonema cortianum]|nr:hypothetical protein [Geitlerinema splendidum]MDK3156375.1 hypothetical protein [Kamptonema cortianum]